MRASTDQVRHVAVDAVDAARHRASDLVSTGADLVTSTLEKGSATLEGGIERVAEKTPLVSVGVTRPRRHRVRTTLIALGALVAILVIAKKLTGQMGALEDSNYPTPSDPPSPTITSDDQTEPVASGSG